MKGKWVITFLMFAVTMAAGTAVSEAATLAGKVAFEGTAPVAEPIAMDADPNCQMAHPEGMASNDVIVNANGTLKNVFVYVKEGLPAGQTYPAPTEPLKFDQHGCMYDPKVFGIMVGQPLEIWNSDDTLHNVHALAKNSPEFNLGMPIKGMKLKKTFTSPEVMVKIKCEVHPWMAAYAGVVAHPFYAVSGDDGSFEIKDLPPGKYVVETWHEKYGAQTQEVEVTTPEDKKDLAFSYKAA